MLINMVQPGVQVVKTGGVYRHNSDVFKKLHGKLLTFKTGKRAYKEGSTGSRGG